jgi:putative MATE family efflux protein
MGHVIRLAAPAVGTMFLHTAMSIIDTIWVGRLGADQLAAVISSMFVIWILFSLIGIFDTGTVAVLSRHYGAGNLAHVAHSGRQAVVLGLGGSIIVGLLGVLAAESLYDVMNTTETVKSHGVTFLSIIFAGAIFIFMGELLNAVFRATGDTKTPMVVSMISIALNIVLDPLLIFGIGPFPRLEIAGAALATIIAYCAGFLLYLLAIKLGKLTFAFSWGKLVGVDWPMLWQMVRIGTPVSLSGVIFSVVYLFMTRITATFGTEAIAALGVGNRTESISYLLCFGFYMAVATLVGQNLGARQPERAARSTWYAVGITVGITTLIAAAFLIFPKPIASLFTKDPLVQEHAVSYLRILALSQPAMAIMIVLEGAFSGAGNTLPPMVISVAHSTMRLPIALLFCFPLGVGVSGIFWAITLTTIGASLMSIVWFRRGKWKLKEVN